MLLLCKVFGIVTEPLTIRHRDDWVSKSMASRGWGTNPVGPLRIW